MSQLYDLRRSNKDNQGIFVFDGDDIVGDDVLTEALRIMSAKNQIKINPCVEFETVGVEFETEAENASEAFEKFFGVPLDFDGDHVVADMIFRSTDDDAIYFEHGENRYAILGQSRW